ncbi:hypothetical protein BRADI_3g08946v3 [Brachypodium distachyon]|uniref:Uncharacterized protein n=1 Tax=Brachypodium distachyon TaxID=15368 RepID=A0A0Q3LNV2_BRADI|nr:hypothetical protein BRADI_3g08946v3 [Brachypodium distachyon]
MNPASACAPARGRRSFCHARRRLRPFAAGDRLRPSPPRPAPRRSRDRLRRRPLPRLPSRLSLSNSMILHVSLGGSVHDSWS